MLILNVEIRSIGSTSVCVLFWLHFIDIALLPGVFTLYCKVSYFEIMSYFYLRSFFLVLDIQQYYYVCYFWSRSFVALLMISVTYVITHCGLYLVLFVQRIICSTMHFKWRSVSVILIVYGILIAFLSLSVIPNQCLEPRISALLVMWSSFFLDRVLTSESTWNNYVCIW
jgi:hypothetical protein